MSSSPSPAEPSPAAVQSVSILGTGSYLPERIMTNVDLSKIVDTSDEWISSRTGIRQRRIAAEGQTTSEMAYNAALPALKAAGVDPAELDLIIVSTCTPDMMYPATACFLQQMLGAGTATAFDLSAACSGFVYAMETARNFVATGASKRALVVAAEKNSAVLDWTDRNTCVLFGDGAGAAVLGHVPGKRGIMSTDIGADGSGADILYLNGRGTRKPPEHHRTANSEEKIYMAGRDVYKRAVIIFPETVVRALEKAGVAAEELACVVPHQANERIIASVADRLGLGLDRFYLNLDKYGNTSSAAVAIALDEAARAGRFKRGDLVLLTTFGGGLTWGSQVIEW